MAAWAFGWQFGQYVMLFAIPEGSTLLWKSWEGEHKQVVYHVQAGRTHLLDELAAWVVELLEASPRSTEAICQLMADEFQLEDEVPQIQQHLTGLLPQLAELGLIEERNSCS